MTSDQLQMLLAALIMRHWRDIEATSRGVTSDRLRMVIEEENEAKGRQRPPMMTPA